MEIFANLATGFFQGMPISSSSSRIPVAEAAGARTQLTGVVGALAIALLLTLAPDLLRHLPQTALAASQSTQWIADKTPAGGPAHVNSYHVDP